MRKILDLEKLISKYDMNIKGVIHIGAHFGEENRVYDALDIKNRIFFEPQNSNFSVLKERIGGKFPIIQKALGNENKKVTMFVERNNKGQSSSVLKPALHLTQYPKIKFEEVETVEMARLDDLGIDFSPYNFISIDVQGYELEVFKGAEKTLKNIDYIVAEINKAELYENCARVEQLVEFLAPYGFKLVEENWIGGTWGDGLFIKKP
jgi:FkbM family methyltransferase